MMPKQSQKLKWVWITATTIAITFGSASAQSEDTKTTLTQENDKAITVESPVPDLDNDPDQLGALGRIHKGEQSIAPNEYRQVMRGLRMLRSGDPKIREGGRNLLTNMNEATDVSKFLEAMIPVWYDAQQVRESFGILWDLDRPSAIRLAKKLAVSQPAVHRAEAIRLLAKAGGSSNEKLIARGFVDVASEVRIIAAVSVLQLDDVRKYTPLLIDGLSESAPSYRRVWIDALSRAWNVSPGTDGADNPSYWAILWEEQKQSVLNTYDKDSLTPLNTQSLNQGDLVSI